MKHANTYEVKIFVGLKDCINNIQYGYEALQKICQNYVDEHELCLTITKTQFMYANGNEYGAIVGLINYPRFPDSEGNIKKYAIQLAKIFKKQFKQRRMSIMFPGTTIMLEEHE